MRKLIFGLIILLFTAPVAYAATEFALPELDWGASRETIAAKAQGELYSEENSWLWYTAYDAYEGGIVESQYHFNANNELCGVSWRMRPQIESDIEPAQMLLEYNRLKEVLLLNYGAPSENLVYLERGAEKNMTYPDVPPAPTVADIQPGAQHMFESRWLTGEVTIFLYVMVTEEGRTEISVSFHNEKYK